MKPLVLAITGASGAIYGVRLLQQLLAANQLVHLVLSDSGRLVIHQELGILLDDPNTLVSQLLQFPRGGLPTLVQALPDWTPWEQGAIPSLAKRVVLHDARNFMAPIASGSFRTSGMVICPCSGSTLSGIVHAGGRDLIQRAAEVHLKERRKLMVVPRETPLSLFQIENMQRLASAGGLVMPAMPGWYHGVGGLLALVDFLVARILDHLEIEHQLMQRWGEASLSGADGEEDDR